jgi:hypothetical protein
LRKVFQLQELGPDLGCKVFILKGTPSKVLILDEKDRSASLRPDFGPDLIVACGAGKLCKADVVEFGLLRWFWGLTCDFWAENAEK